LTTHNFDSIRIILITVRIVNVTLDYSFSLYHFSEISESFTNLLAKNNILRRVTALELLNYLEYVSRACRGRVKSRLHD